MILVLVLSVLSAIFFLPFLVFLVRGFLELMEDVRNGWLNEATEIGLAICSILGVVLLYAAIIAWHKL